MARASLVAQTVRNAFAVGIALVISVSPARARDAADELAVQREITVTGSRIEPSDYVGWEPVTAIQREDTDASGELSIAELLRTQTFKSFRSLEQRSGRRTLFLAHEG